MMCYTSTLSKVYTSVLNMRLTKYLESMNLIAEEQGGFRKGRSCSDQMFILTSLIKNRLNLNKDTFVSFIDMEKCFDWVDRDMMLYKLFSFNVDGKFYKAINSIYRDSVSSIRLNDLTTNVFNVSCGVRQGDVLSPTLFSIMINDLAIGINNLNLGVKCGDAIISLLMYADDLALIAESPENLQKMLDYLFSWCRKWRMKVNSQKTKVVHFRKKRKRLTDFIFHYNTDVIEKVPHYRYLGLFLDEHLDFRYGIDMLNDSGSRALGAIISKFKSLKDAGYNTYAKLFTSCVEPILDYCSGIWGYVNHKDLNKVFNRAIRFYLGLPPKTPIFGFQGDMGWLLPKYRLYFNMAKLYNRFCKMDNSRLTKRMFLWDKMQPGKSWFNELVEIANRVDYDIPDNQSIDLNVFMEKCNSLQNQEWLNNLPSKPKLRTYVTFKDKVCTEPYIYNNLCKGTRSIMSQLRMGVLPLNIETGRYDKTPIERRICKQCNQNAIEDEPHFVCSCPAYNNERQKLYESIKSIDTYFNNVPNAFCYIMEHHQLLVAKFVCKAWNMRKIAIYHSK